MTYIISGFRSEGRVRIGRVGLRDLHARQLAGLGATTAKISGGTGSATDPLGGVGGAPENVLRALVAAGLTFKAPKAETGLLNGEKYIYVQGNDKKFYKFKMTGTGGIAKSAPTDAAAIAWFNGVVNDATPKTKVPPAVTIPAGVVLPGIQPRPTPINPNVMKQAPLDGGSGGSGGNTTLIVGGGLALVVAFFLLNKRKAA